MSPTARKLNVAALAITTLFAEQGIVILAVRDTQGNPIPGVQIAVEGSGSTTPTDRNGTTRLRVDPQTRPGNSLTLRVVGGPSDFVIISPSDRRALVPSFEDKAENYVPITLAKKESVADLLRAPNAQLRRDAAQVLAAMGPEARPAIPALIQSLKDADLDVRALSALALAKIAPVTDQGVLLAVEALRLGSSADQHQSAIIEIARLGSSGKIAIPELVEVARNERDTTTGRSSAATVVVIAKDLHDKRDWTALPVLQEAVPRLQGAGYKDEANDVRREAEYLDAIRPHLGERLRAAFKETPELAWGTVVVCLYLAWFLVLRLAILRAAPLAILRWNQSLAKLDWKLPKWLGEGTVPFRNVLVVGLYRRHRRVLDAWVAQHIGEARRAFTENPTYAARKVYVPLSVVLKGKRLAELRPEDLHADCGRKQWCILIRGEGGLGKTTLACQLALWGMGDQPRNRLTEDRQMLPVLIEPGLGFDVQRNVADFRREILGKLKRLVGEPHVEDELLNALLETRRVLVILDGLSEMPSSVDDSAKARLDNPDFPAAALLVTSRNDERLREDVTLLPSRVEKERLIGFMTAYIAQAGVPDLEDAALFDACRRLADMLSEGGRDATPLLAKMYAEQLIALFTGIQPLNNLPATIPDLMLGYVSHLNRYRRDTQPDNPTLHRAAQIAAWNCLQEAFRPGEASKAKIQDELKQAGLGANLLDDLDRLGLVRTIPPAETHVRFLVDPLSEYLAGMSVLEFARGSEDSWRRFIADADSKPGSPDLIRGLLGAVRDCCLARARERIVPDFVLAELSQRMGRGNDETAQARIQRRIRRLIDNLQRAEESPDRLYALNELSKLRPLTEEMISAITDALKDLDAEVRGSAAEQLGRIGIEARVAVPALTTALKDSNTRVSTSAVQALGQIGVTAVPALITALEDSNAHVSTSAVKALGRIGVTAVPALVGALKEGSQVGALCMAFMEIGPEAIPALVGGLEDSDPGIRINCAMAMSLMRAQAKAAVPALVLALKDSHPGVRAIAAHALGCMGAEAKEAEPALLAALNDISEDIREIVAKALERIGAEAQ